MIRPDDVSRCLFAGDQGRAPPASAKVDPQKAKGILRSFFPDCPEPQGLDGLLDSLELMPRLFAEIAEIDTRQRSNDTSSQKYPRADIQVLQTPAVCCCCWPQGLDHESAGRVEISMGLMVRSILLALHTAEQFNAAGPLRGSIDLGINPLNPTSVSIFGDFDTIDSHREFVIDHGMVPGISALWNDGLTIANQINYLLVGHEVSHAISAHFLVRGRLTPGWTLDAGFGEALTARHIELHADAQGARMAYYISAEFHKIFANAPHLNPQLQATRFVVAMNVMLTLLDPLWSCPDDEVRSVYLSSALRFGVMRWAIAGELWSWNDREMLEDWADISLAALDQSSAAMSLALSENPPEHSKSAHGLWLPDPPATPQAVDKRALPLSDRILSSGELLARMPL